jgi:enoyl-CoA hydratase/carnithine racemase
MALFCDLRVAAQDTLLALPEAQWGLMPAAGATQTLPRIAGGSRAMDLALTGRRITAEEALRMGLVSFLVPPDELEMATDRIASDLSILDPYAVRAARRAVREGAEMSLAAGLDLEARLAAGLARAGDQA